MKESNYGISVVLPVFHRQPSVDNINLLKRSLESIKDQRISVDHEILLVDDGSPVPIFEFKDLLGEAAHDVTWIRIQNNRGLVNALNTGILAAKHSLIARLDADDVWLPSKIDKQLSQFEADENLTISATGMSLVTPDGSHIEDHIRPSEWNEILKFFVDVGCPFPHGSVVAKKEIYRLLGGYPHSGNFSHCEDYALWGTWLRFFKPTMVEEALYNYTVSETSVSAIHGEQQRNASRLVLSRFSKGNLANRLPDALISLARCLDISVISAGKLSYLLWQFNPDVSLPGEAIDLLRVILYDREFSTNPSGRSSRNWRDLIGWPMISQSQTRDEIGGRFYSL
ncbi:glycosyltransferase [Paraburkholderia pallida]|uniref:Glycosyltransferase n=1 Tax=Paraburkholderia pallida TaxID=2547399 RepID=A0A4P7CW60_9BURK|nr:glycosyltransferase [Paraburkholderia pallida]QBQ98354.1 glycosyltransferase [Paraburkholderia pallida]